MKVTNEMLEQFGIELEEPIEFSKFVAKENIPLDAFHYIDLYYRLSPEEKELYLAICNIKNCENFWYSDTITNSRNLYNSHKVVGSIFVRDSNDVNESIDVYNSNNISNTNDIAHSSYVFRASRIIESQEIHDSCDIARSNNIDWSFVILNSNHLDNCSYTYMSDNLVDCHFCGFMHNSRHCLFCVGLEDKEYYIFNQPVSQLEYEQAKEKLEAMLEDEKSTMIKINESKHTAEERFRLDRRFDSVFKGLSSSFYGWISTLPNYSDDAFLDLFFRDREEVLKTNEVPN